MSILPTIIAAKRRVHRKRRGAPFGPAPLTLVRAWFDPALGRVSLTFDRDINFADDWRADEFHVVDGATTMSEYVGNADGAGRTGAEFGMIMDVAGATPEGQVLLSVGSGNGLVAADDGGTWAGVTDLELPFPANQIVQVRHASDTDQIVVSLSTPLVAFDDISKMIGVSSDGENWIYAYNLNNEDPLNILFFMSGDASGATQWRVPGADNWHFAGGQILGEPTTGTITSP